MNKRGIFLLLAFNIVYLAIFGFKFFTGKNYEFIMYIGVIVALGLLVFLTGIYKKLSSFTLWGLSIWGLLHMMGGGVRVAGAGLYRYKIIELINNGGDFYILKMDQVIHFYGFFIAAFVVYDLLKEHFKEKKLPLIIIFIVWIGSMGLGALNEVVEFIAFVTLEKTGVGDLYNTGLDLVFNMFGALFGACVAYWRGK